ncbi:MAG: hypothetical protein SFZ02_04845 [bacterium]|nr:hypothetical protein [bacterium]
MLRLLIFIFTSLPAGLAFEDVQRSLNIFGNQTTLRLIFDIFIGCTAGFLASQAAPKLNITISKSQRVSQNRNSSKSINFEISDLTPIAILCSVTGFIAIYATAIDVLVFINQKISWEVPVLYFFACSLMIFSFCAVISFIDGTAQEKGNFISIASIGGAIGIGVIVAQEVTLGQGLIGTLFEFLGGSLLAFTVIVIGIYMTVLLYDFASMMSDRKPIRRAFIMFFLGYISIVALSVFDVWRWLITL